MVILAIIICLLNYHYQLQASYKLTAVKYRKLAPLEFYHLPLLAYCHINYIHLCMYMHINSTITVNSAIIIIIAL